MVNILKAIGLSILSIVLGTAITYGLTILNQDFGASVNSFYFLVAFIIFLAVSLNYVFNRGEKKKEYGGLSSPWGPPEDIRDRVVSTPQFVGRFDRARGLLESTARMVTHDSAPYESMSRPEQAKVLRLRGELLDQNGSPLEYIPVEIKGQVMKWIGDIVEGDRIRVEGTLSDGVLHTRSAFNFSTNSWVGERQRTP